MPATTVGSARQHLWPRRQPGRRALVIGILALTAGTANAQFSRYADEIELKRLDFHPKPSFRREVGSEIYGVLDQALIWRRGDDPSYRCDQLVQGGTSFGGLSASFVGFRSTEILGAGWRVHLTLEQGLRVNTGELPLCDSAFFDRTAGVGLSHRIWGRIEFGRLEQPAWRVALLADPWAGDSVASPGDRNYYDSPANRSNNAILYTSPETAGWTFQFFGTARASPGLFFQSERAAQDDAVEASKRPANELGLAIRYQSGGLTTAAGWQRWSAGTWAWPVSVVYTLDHWRGYAGLTVGQSEGKDYRNLLLGAAIPERSGPHPGEWRFGLNLHRIDGQPSQRKFSAGHVCPFSKRTALQMELSVEPRPGAATQARLGFGIRHAFTL
ncbi:MAG: porin [Ideonella sp.]|nr:porin [Ideonella sp.]